MEGTRQNPNSSEFEHKTELSSAEMRKENILLTSSAHRKMNWIPTKWLNSFHKHHFVFYLLFDLDKDLYVEK